jgi:hypothetical protein
LKVQRDKEIEEKKEKRQQAETRIQQERLQQVQLLLEKTQKRYSDLQQRRHSYQLEY